MKADGYKNILIMEAGDTLVMPYVRDSKYTTTDGDKKYYHGGNCRGGYECEIVDVYYRDIRVEGRRFKYKMRKDEFTVNSTSEEYSLTF